MKKQIVTAAAFLVLVATSYVHAKNYRYRTDPANPPLVSFVFFGDSDSPRNLAGYVPESLEKRIWVQAALDGELEFSVGDDSISIVSFELTLQDPVLGLLSTVSSFDDFPNLAEALVDGARLADLLAIDPLLLEGFVAPVPSLSGMTNSNAFIGDYENVQRVDDAVVGSLISSDADAYLSQFPVGAEKLSLRGGFLSRSDLAGIFRISTQVEPGLGLPLRLLPNFTLVPEPSSLSVILAITSLAALYKPRVRRCRTVIE